MALSSTSGILFGACENALCRLSRNLCSASDSATDGLDENFQLGIPSSFLALSVFRGSVRSQGSTRIFAIGTALNGDTVKMKTVIRGAGLGADWTLCPEF